MPTRSDLPLHDLTGGNTFIPDILPDIWGAEVNSTRLQAGKQRASNMLQMAATSALELADKELKAAQEEAA